MPNHLRDETSPYLLQHADNPVDWYPWGAAALTAAREQDKPILLSVGYSACHWCHVMAHESFEDPAVAATMNARFINIKVDREERPDLDQIYQTAQAMLMHRPGGWPLTMFLTPQQTPFFGGTYFPKTPRGGMPGFEQLLSMVADAYRDRKESIAQQGASLRESLSSMAPAASDDALTRAPLAKATRELLASVDREYGGFGQAPKFPHAAEWSFLLRRAALDGNDDALAMTRLTATRMVEGGIFDHLGGGFCRYSTDGEWTIPHFEKMLYDNGALLGLYSNLWACTQEARYEEVVRATIAWTLREMQARRAAFIRRSTPTASTSKASSMCGRRTKPAPHSATTGYTP